VVTVAWMRMMGAESVAYHRETIIERADDHAGQALEYYASRGETPLVWGGAGAEAFGLEGSVTDAQYDALFGPGGAVDPTTGERLVQTTRPGLELVISAHKSVAELGVLGRAEDMHSIMDAERDATLSYLDALTLHQGGRRGRAAVPTPTSGLIYAHARHATSRAGDPCPHDHVLIANVLAMGDDVGGYKAAHTALWRNHLHAATVVGRMASARVAVELGYAIEADPGPSGRLGHWAIAGLPKEALDVHSKRAAEIEEHARTHGYDSYRARGIAARETRKAKRHEAVDDLLPRWRDELARAGYPVRDLEAGIDAAIEAARIGRGRATETFPKHELASLIEDTLDPDGDLASRKVFFRRDVVVAVGPALYGRPVEELERATAAVLADHEAVPLVGVPGVSERPYATATTIAREAAIAERVAEGTGRRVAAVADGAAVHAALARTQKSIGAPLSADQVAAVSGIATSGRGVELVVGVAGAGKTTALAVVRDAFETCGYDVVGTATSGQAAQALRAGAGIDASRTLSSLLWRLEHRSLELTERSVVILDEVGMTADPDLLRLLAHVEEAAAKAVLVGDYRQLGAVGPGGALEALVTRHGGVVHHLADNVRQRDPAEREALGDLRDGDLARAIAFYAERDRILPTPTRAEALEATASAWADDVAAGADAAMFAWRRANVAELNALGREHWAEMGRLSGDELLAPGGAVYQAGDRIVTLASGSDGRLVTSERGTVSAVDIDAGTLTASMADGRTHHFTAEETAADRLAHGYALTVHRAQGVTVDVTHRYEDGGGRELAYVAMSRARGPSYVHTVADDVVQAKSDLARDWAVEARQRWVLDTAPPARSAGSRDSVRADPIDAAKRLARLEAERAAVLGACPLDPEPKLCRLQHAVNELGRDRYDLMLGKGRWAGTEVGKLAAELYHATIQKQNHEHYSHSMGNSRAHSRSEAKQAREWARRETQLQARWDRVGAPVRAGLDAEIGTLEGKVGALRKTQEARQEWLGHHPEAARRLDRLEREVTKSREAIYLERAIANGLRQRARAKELGRDFGRELGRSIGR
jgi:conjugative relaxase-like TrwC/TraI family protein